MDPPPDTPPPGPDLPAVEPDPSIPKTLGLLNVIFAGLLLLCGGCMGANLIIQLAMMPVMQVQQEQVRVSMDAAHQNQIADLRRKEDAAKDPKEKAALQRRRQTLENQPPPKPPDLTKVGPFGSPQILAYSLTDVFTGLVLNVAMLVAGIGLLNFKEWGRQMGIWVAAIKLARLFLLYGYFIIAIVPTYSKQIMEMFQNVAPAGAGGPQPQQVAEMGSAMGVMMAVSTAGMIVLGAIYPVICLLLLPRASAKAACQGPVVLAEEA